MAGTDGNGSGGLPNYGIALVPIGSTNLDLDSKESSLTSHAPQLDMVLNHATTADTATTLTQGRGPLEKVDGVPAA